MATPFQPIEGKYEILEKMREGGMGTLYKVRHRLLDEVRVIKVMRPHLAADETLRARFLREARTVIRLRHPNIAQLYDFTVDADGRAFIVMEYIDGVTLQEMMRNVGVPALGLGLELAQQSLRAIAYLHRRGVIHRDIAPDNLMVRRDEDGAPEVKLIDLGIAKVVEAGASGLTTTGTFLGKVRYSSPEHFASAERGQVEPRSDLYSFGVVLYELLTGRYPIHGGSTTGLIAGHLVHPPLEFAESDPHGRVPEPLRALVLELLAKQPGDRPADAAAARARLRELQRDHPWRPENLDEVFAAPVTARIPVVRPGSTQERLDREFGAAGTPAPSAAGAPPPAHTAPLEGLRQAPPPVTDRIAELLLEAERLVGAGRHDEARLQLQAVRELDADHAEARRLEAVVDAAEARRRERAREALERAQALLAEGELTAARRELSSAESEGEEAAALEDLRLALHGAEAERELRRQRFAGAVEEAERLVGEGEATAAERALAVAAELAPEHEAVERLTGGIAGLRARRAAEQAAAAARVVELVEQGDLDAARQRLEGAAARFGDAGALADAAQRLAEAEAERRRREDLEDHLAAAGAALADEALVTALEAVEHARAVARSAAEAGRVEALASEVLDAMAEARRRQEVAAAVAGIGEALARDELEQAERALALARKLYGVDEALAPVEAELVARREAERAARVEALEATAADALDRGEAAEAMAAARAALELEPGRATATELVERAAAAARERAGRHERQQVETAAREAAEHLDAGRLEEAQRALEVARRVLGDRPELQQAEERLAAARAAKVRSLVESAFARGVSFQRAIAGLEAALALDPDATQVRELLERTRAAAAEAAARGRSED